jgi:hypothetical protein
MRITYLDLHLGLVFNNDGICVNHRSLLKVICNPFLRLVGWQIASDYHYETKEMKRYVLERVIPRFDFNGSWFYDMEDGYTIQKTRRFL